ncbi:MAG TPA: NADPH-dependent F420 reductase [Methylomirabilota bacterium]|nr:NADPH-dependent F420 reductase [Methylomirabilota bacterium]
MRIAVIGAGNVGGALGRVWAQRGHQVVFGVRDPEAGKIRTLVQGAGANATAARIAPAVAGADVVVLAVPWSATGDTIAAAGDLRGKILVDATNPLTPDVSDLAIGHDTSGGEQLARRVPAARVVKAFNTIGAMHLADPTFGGQRASMFLCGDDAAAKATVAELAQAVGFEPVDVGPLRQARLLEPLAMLWISMAVAHGFGPNIAFKLLRK